MTQVSYAQRDTNHPIPQKIERGLTSRFRHIQQSDEEIQKVARDSMRARVINWAMWKSGERRAIARLTGQITESAINSACGDECGTVSHIDDIDAVIINKAVEQLHIPLYLVINYKFLQGQENQWIADKLKFSKRTVNNRVDDALNKLVDLTR